MDFRLRIRFSLSFFQIAVISLFSLFFFTGCGNTHSSTAPKQEVEQIWQESEEFLEEYQKEQTNQLLNGNWKHAEIQNPDSFMLYTEFFSDIFQNTENENRWNRGYCVDEDNLYSLDYYYEENPETEEITVYHVLSVVNAVTKELQTIRYDGNYFITSFQVIDGRVFGVHTGMDENGIMDSYLCIELLPDGNIVPMEDMIAIVESEDMLPAQHFVSEVSMYFEPTSGQYFLLSPDKDRLFLADGKYQQYSVTEPAKPDNRFQMLAASLDGHCMFMEKGNQYTSVFYFEQGKRILLYENSDGLEIDGGCAMVDSHGRFVFEYLGGIISWDTESGVLERLYIEPGEHEYFPNIQCVMRNRNGELLLLKNGDLKVITKAGPDKQVKLSIKPFLYTDISDMLQAYEATHPGITFEVLPVAEWEQRDAERNMMLSEIAKGGGADILLLDRENMLVFDKNDCLLDLSQVLTADILEKLVDGVLQNGMTDNGLKMLSFDSQLHTLIINSKYTKGDSITVDEVLDLIKEREKRNDPFEELVVGSSYYYDSPLSVFLFTIGESELIDREKGICHFDSPQFVEILEICKRYYHSDENSNPSNDTACYNMLKNDKALFYYRNHMSFVGFSESMAALGPEYVAIGYPTDAGNGNRLSFFSGLSVNKNTMHSEVIYDFFNWMYSAENKTFLYHVPLRTDAYEGRILPKDEYGFHNGPSISLGHNSVIPLAGKPDGTSYVDEYMELINNCGPDDIYGDQNMLYRIIAEETESLFRGDKTAEEVAEVIQSRISLYLSENM